jgi:hypothetical protein
MKNNVYLYHLDKTIFGVRLEYSLNLEGESREFLVECECSGVPGFEPWGTLQAAICLGIPYASIGISWGGYSEDEDTCDCEQCTCEGSVETKTKK